MTDFENNDGSDRYMIVSADTHAGAGVLDYKYYLESKWHDEFDAWAKNYHDAWLDVDTHGDMKIGVASGDQSHNWDSDRRVKELEAEGIAGEVVIPNTSPPFFPSGVIMAGNPKTRDEYERRWAGLRAHNRWLVDFCSLVPGRRAGMAQIFLNDVDDAVAEVEWIKSAGLTGGILLPLVQPADTLPPLYSTEYDRLYAACADLGIPMTQHAGSVGNPSDDIQDGVAINYTELEFFSHRGMWHMILGGVFERHPSLSYVMTEQFIGWVPERLLMLDLTYEQARLPNSVARAFIGSGLDSLTMKPSEYWMRNCYVGASFMLPSEADVRDGVGVDRIMWGADYPHAEGTPPYTLAALRATFANVPVDECRLMLGETAADVYGLDREKLYEAARRVGPTLEAVHTPLDEWPRFPQDTWCYAFADPKALGSH
jgi:predicted TIM-barrel fold metal-dependent hydrolase